MPTFNNTPGDPQANSYPSVNEFTDYWTLWQFRQPAWIVGATNQEIEGALMSATLIFDSSFIWTGAPNVPPQIAVAQALAWPRNGMLDINNVPITNLAADPACIPGRLKDAVCEFAGQLWAQDRLADDDADKFQVQSVRAGDVDVRLQRASLETIESADIWARLKGPEFNWMSKEVPEAVRRMLLGSWYQQPTIKRPLVFKAFGASRRNR